MKRNLGIVVCISVLIVLVSAPIAGAQLKLEGVWKAVEVRFSGPNARTVSNPQPCLYICNFRTLGATKIPPGRV